MNQLTGLLTNNSRLARCELARARPLWPAWHDDWVVGAGAYDDGTVLTRRFGRGVPKAGALELPVSPVALWAAGTLGVSQSLEDDGQPFRFRQWLVACDVRALSTGLHRLLVESLPDFLRASLKGSTAAEVIFLTLVAQLRSTGRLDDSEAPPAAVALALTQTGKLVKQLALELTGPSPAFALLATNGALLSATCVGPATVSYRMLEGEPGCATCGLVPPFDELSPRVRDHRLRRTVVVSTQVADPAGWKTLGDEAALVVDRRLGLTLSK